MPRAHSRPPHEKDLALQNTKELQRMIDNMAGRTPLKSLTADVTLSEEEQALVDRCVQGVKEDGYAIVENFLDDDRLEWLRDEMEPIFEMTGNRASDRPGWDGMQTVHVPNLFGKTRAADDLAIDPIILSIVEGILGVKIQMSAAVAMCPGPGTEAQGFHQDDLHWPIPRPHVPLVANTLIALDDFTPENGATKLVPGSHKSVEPIPDDPSYIHVEMPAGSLAVWDGAIWHAGGANRTKDQRRRTINLNYNLSWLRQQENQYLGVPRKTMLSLPEKLQRILGYQRVNGVCGGIDYQDPHEYLKNIAGD